VTDSCSLVELAAGCDVHPAVAARALLCAGEPALRARLQAWCDERGVAVAARDDGARVGILSELRSMSENRDHELVHDQMTYHAPVVLGMLVAAEAYGLAPVPVTGIRGETGSERGARLLREGELDALILPRSSTFAPDLLAATGAPVILLGRQSGGRFARVDTDLAAGAELMVDHLHQLGHRQLAWVGPMLTDHEQVRATAFEARCRERDLACERIELPQSLPLRGRSSANAAVVADAIASQMDAEHPVTAVGCYNEVIAFGLYRLAARYGWTIPERLAVVGIDDIYARGCDPALTSISNMNHEVGFAALQLACETLTGLMPATSERLVVPRLQVRASTRAE